MLNAPIYCEDTVTSTMDVSRQLAAKGEPHGTVICAEYQKKGRGRGKGRSWQTKSGESLLFTVLLRYPKIEVIPKAITLRAGLAVADAIEEFEPALSGKVNIKWPNDIIINKKKAAGILCEAEGGIAHIGIGINVTQKEFPPELKDKAISISLAAEKAIEPEKRFDLLKIILSNLYIELKESSEWKKRIEEKLYKKGQIITFIEGAADSGKEVQGMLRGINDNGEIIIDNSTYTTGEILNLKSYA